MAISSPFKEIYQAKRFSLQQAPPPPKPNTFLSFTDHFKGYVAVGVDPTLSGISPTKAVPAVLRSSGLQIADISLFELNEAFASEYVYCCKKLNLNTDKVNVNGGAIALGHPLGATGARCVATLVHEMKRRGKNCRYGVIAMSIGSEITDPRGVQSHNLLPKDAFPDK